MTSKTHKEMMRAIPDFSRQQYTRMNDHDVQ